jgi:hypothetical protein
MQGLKPSRLAALVAMAEKPPPCPPWRQKLAAAREDSQESPSPHGVWGGEEETGLEEEESEGKVEKTSTSRPSKASLQSLKQSSKRGSKSPDRRGRSQIRASRSRSRRSHRGAARSQSVQSGSGSSSSSDSGSDGPGTRSLSRDNKRCSPDREAPKGCAGDKARHMLYAKGQEVQYGWQSWMKGRTEPVTKMGQKSDTREIGL